jgi:hypothetical protein
VLEDREKLILFVLVVMCIVLIFTSTATAIMGGDPSDAMGINPIEGPEINIVADYCRYF